MSDSRGDQRIRTRQRTVCLASPAKLNLGLFLTGRRQDGYHLLESLFWPIGLKDTITLTEGAPIDVKAHWAADCALPGAALPQGSDNLVFRCLEASGLGAADLEKRIPMGGGLGGGSSNAGTVLRYAWKRGLISEEVALKTAVSAGADVPFFLHATPAWVSGIGERIEPVRIASDVAQGVHFLLVLLPTPTPTNEVFRAFKESGQAFSASRGFTTTEILTLEGLTNYLKTARNDLEGAASRVNPLIAEALVELRRLPSIYAGLSGSGSTCFAVFADSAFRDSAAKEISTILRKRKSSCVRTETYVPSETFDTEMRPGEQRGNHRS